MIIKWSDIPGYREAIKREGDVRDASFLDLTTSICGVEIRQMTPRDLLILDGVGNPLVVGGLPTPAHVAQFLWLLSPKFKPNSKGRQWIFTAGIRRINYIAAVRDCRKYVADTFMDSPGSSGESYPYASWCAHMVANIALHFGWTHEVVLSTPLKQLFQYLKCIRRHNDPKAPMHNPSDKCKGDYLRLLNGRSKLLTVLKRRASQ